MGDLIDRNALFAQMYKLKSVGELTAKSAIRMVVREPAIDAEPVRHGRWEKITYQNSRGELWQGRTCNRCVEAGYERGYVLAIGEPNQNYCPQCGARMDGGNTDD